MPLSDEIAVLDGLDDLPNYYASRDILDASAGANYSGGSSYAPGLPLLPSNSGLADLPSYYASRDILDASAGANYSGGSSYAPGLPLLPSNAGLAGFADEDLAAYGIQAGVLKPQRNVLDASEGANYSGGSSYAPGLPLLPSNAGLAEHYDGKPLDRMDDYWGSTMGVMQNAYSTGDVLDASEGANYSGGSSYAPGLPLLPSSAGLAGLDAVSDRAFRPMLRSPGLRQAFQRVASKQALDNTKVKLNRLQQIANGAKGPISRETYMRVKQALIKCQQELNAQRKVRANILKPSIGLPTTLTPQQRALAVARRALGARA
jgi:hypothetical protein